MQDLAAQYSRKGRTSFALFWLWQLVPLVWFFTAVTLPEMYGVFSNPLTREIAELVSWPLVHLWLSLFTAQGAFVGIWLVFANRDWRVKGSVSVVALHWIAISFLSSYYWWLLPLNLTALFWKDTLNITRLEIFTLYYAVVTCLPSFVLCLSAYLLGWRLRLKDASQKSGPRFQFSLSGLCLLMLLLSLALGGIRLLLNRSQLPGDDFAAINEITNGGFFSLEMLGLKLLIATFLVGLVIHHQSKVLAAVLLFMLGTALYMTWYLDCFNLFDLDHRVHEELQTFPLYVMAQMVGIGISCWLLGDEFEGKRPLNSEPELQQRL